MIDLNVVVWIALGVFGSGVLIALLRGQGQGDTRMVIDGRTFQFPQWVMSAIDRGMSAQEVDAVNDVGLWDVLEQRALRQLATLPKEQKAARRQTQDAVANARRELAAARKHAQRAYEDAGRRWLLSDDGQQWLQSRGLRFP